MTCPAFAPDGGFVATMLNYVDCQAQAIGGGGYQALATPGSTLSLVLTGLLTLFVALFGYIGPDEQPRQWPATGWLDTPQAMSKFLERLTP